MQATESQIIGRIRTHCTRHNNLRILILFLFLCNFTKAVNDVSTDERGYFQLKNNKRDHFYLKVNFLGYKASTLDNIVISGDNMSVNLGEDDF